MNLILGIWITDASLLKNPFYPENPFYNTIRPSGQGTLLRAKSLSTDKAWEVYDYLKNC